MSRGERELQLGISCWSARGELERALSHFDTAMTWALEQGDSELWDRAFCNRCAAEMHSLGTTKEWLGELREIVLRSKDPETGFLSAYNVACAYERDKEYDRAMFYARIARDRCRSLGRRDWMAWSRNQIGNVLVAQSEFEEACREYLRALDLMSAAKSIARAMVLDNLGYCRHVQGRYDEGFDLLFRGLRMVRSVGGKRFEGRLRLSLCFGYLEIGRQRRALEHGLAALELGTTYDDDDVLKNAHYLVGEAYNELGHHETAHDFFVRLQRRYYPDAVHVPELLMAVDVRKLVNLKA